MIGKLYINKIAAALMIIAVFLCMTLIVIASYVDLAADTGVEMQYEKRLFDKEKILDINISIPKDEWQSLLDSAMSEQYYECDIIIDGETFYRVGIRAKGNTSLSSIANDPNSDRYSFKLQFDEYVDSQTCYGLDKLVLNNNYADATSMKEALIYDMFGYIGADASLYSYASVSVNGEYWGLYLALEGVEDSFLLRNYGVGNTKLYKPDGMNMNGGGGGMRGGGGANLNYTDDSLDSYSTVWNGEIIKTNKSDRARVVKALKNISEGNDLESYMDTDNLLRYAAVHIFSQNSDSLSGSMAHNYYLSEQGGRLNIIPWDYNLALGGMGMGRSGADSVINSPIDDAWNSTDFFDTLLSNDTYNEKYYSYLTEIAKDYVAEGGFEEFYNRSVALTEELIKNDPNALYSFEEYLTARETLREAVSLRARSVLSQVNGRNEHIDSSHIDISSMGTMNMGGGKAGDAGPAFGFEKTSEELPEGFTPPEGFDVSDGMAAPEGFAPPDGFEGMPDISQDGAQDLDPSNIGKGDKDSEKRQFGRGGFGGMPSFDGQSAKKDTDTVAWFAISGGVIALALIFAAVFKRR